ncbi:MAG: hypothetical protein V1933_06125 [Candidatus Omnitrophota bacterium]
MATAIVSSDAGGAELLAAYVRDRRLKNPIFYLRGPAIMIFRKRGLIGPSYKFSREWDARISRVLASMSWRDDIAFRMIRMARKRNVKSDMILDSWYDYSGRFGFPEACWRENLPDKLIVCDEVAEKIVWRQHLDRFCGVEKIHSPYLNELLKAYSYLSKKSGKSNDENSLLFLSSPISQARKSNLKEFSGTVLDESDLLEDVIRICERKKIPVKIRLHPLQKYNRLMSYGPMIKNVSICDTGNSLAEDLFGCRHVVGFCSTALVIAALAGKTAISFSKGDIKDIFHWKEFGVYRHYGVHNCASVSSLNRTLSLKADLADLCMTNKNVKKTAVIASLRSQ